MKEEKKEILALSSLVIGILLFLSFFDLPINFCQAQSATSTINVTGLVRGWLSFDISAIALNLGELVEKDGSLHIGHATTTITVSTNNASGWEIQIKGGEPYGLYSSAADHTIPSVTQRSEISTGTEAYGANAESLNQSIQIDDTYIYDSQHPNIVGPIATSSLIASSNNPGLNTSFLTNVKATASIMTPASIYQNSITFTISITTP